MNALKIYEFLKSYKPIEKKFYGYGNSDKKFLNILLKPGLWNISIQKFFSEFKKS